MRNFLILLFAISSFACSQSTAGLSIPARQQFVLGEYMTGSFTASMENRGSVPITVTTVDKQTGSERQRLSLPVGEKASVRVPASEEARLLNATDREADILVVMNKFVEGMSFLDLEGRPLVRIAEQEGEDAGAMPMNKEPLGAPVTSVNTTIPARQQLIVGEGSSDDYSVELSNLGGRNVEVSVLDKETGRQTQGFGLGRFGTVTVTVRPNENLHVENYDDSGCRVRLELSKPVVGARSEEL